MALEKDTVDTTTQDWTCRPIEGASFGRVLSYAKVGANSADAVAALEESPATLSSALLKGHGLVVMPTMTSITDQPELLLRLSRLCGADVENYRNTLTLDHMIHPDIPEILLLGNRPPSARQPPPRPEPAVTAAGALPVQFPHRRGWHTDQSFRRPPPDISLFYCVEPCLKGQGQTLFADGIAAYAGLTAEKKRRIDGVDGLHALLGTGRSEKAVRAGEPVKPLRPHQRSQAQPLVRVHPVNGDKALYLCEGGQMDWVDGPIVGAEVGIHGAGARLVYELMSHYTQPAFTYAHDWEAGDLVIYDNRCLIHSATWYDVDAKDRLMWRTTVGGNPGDEYAGESPSWIPATDEAPMAGLETTRWENPER